METRITALVTLLVVLGAPTASAAGLLPSLVDTCLSSPLATCADSVSPRVTASRLLPSMMVPEEPAADAPEAAPPATAVPPASGAPAQPDAGASDPPATSGTGSAPAASPADAFPMRFALTALVVLAALTLILVVLVLDARERKRARQTTHRDVERARRMQTDIDDAWRSARAAKP